MTKFPRRTRTAVAAIMVTILAGCTANESKRAATLGDSTRSITAAAAGATGINADANATPPAAHDTATSSTSSASNAVSFAGVPPLRIGMSAAEARQALGMPASSAKSGECSYLDTKGRIAAFAMLVRDTVARIDVRDSSLATSAGVRVGDAESRVLEVYRGRVQSEPHKYVKGGHYLVVTSPSDSARRIVFETDGKRVTTWRVGRMPEVRWVEGCS